MSISIKRTRRSSRRPPKAGSANLQRRSTPIAVTAATALGAVLTVTYDQAIALNGVPAYTTDVVGATALSAVMVGTNTVAITFSATVATATEVRIPYEEPAVRNASGGFVSTSTFPV
jgi:hypothetical protein